MVCQGNDNNADKVIQTLQDSSLQRHSMLILNTELYVRNFTNLRDASLIYDIGDCFGSARPQRASTSEATRCMEIYDHKIDYE